MTRLSSQFESKFLHLYFKKTLNITAFTAANTHTHIVLVQNEYYSVHVLLYWLKSDLPNFDESRINFQG